MKSPSDRGQLKSSPTGLPRELADGLLLRQAQLADLEATAEFTVRIHNDHALGISVSDLMCGTHPTTGAEDVVLVTEPGVDGKIVGMGLLISQTWAYDGIPFGIGNPEIIGTDPGYRRRGLARAIVGGLHALSTARGHLAQALTGLRWFYRQFDYEYALDPGTQRQLDLSHVPELSESDRGPLAPRQYRVRRMVEADIPLVAPLYDRQCEGQLITNVLDEAIRRHDISGYSPGSDLGDWSFTVTDLDGRFAGYFSTWGDPWGAFTIKELGVDSDTPSQPVLEAILRFVASQRKTYAHEFSTGAPEKIRFTLPEDNPAHELLAGKLGPPLPRGDWYIRVPDIPRFLRHIRPILDRRLAASPLQGLSGELRISFFRDGIRLVFSNGRLVKATRWQPAGQDETFESTSFPPLVFLKLLFGYRSLAELRYAYPDCWADEHDTLLLDTLFPKLSSWIRQT